MGNLRSVATDIHNPELRKILDEVDPRGGSAPFSVEEKRRAYLEGVGRAGTPEPVTSADGQSVAGPAGSIPIRVYHPISQPGKNRPPIVLYLHGGGFFSGDLDTHDPVCRFLANHIPAVIVAVDYRLAPDHPYPAALDDCLAVLRWLASAGYSLGADASQIFVVGDSAGGNLAAALSLMARDGGGPAIAAQVLIYPMLDATMSCASQVENAFIPPFTLVDCVYAWQIYLPAGTNRLLPYVSPLSAENLQGLPPALVLTAEFDILADEGQSYARRLMQSGVAVEHQHYPDMVHGFFQWGGIVAAGRIAMNRVVQYLQSRADPARCTV